MDTDSFVSSYKPIKGKIEDSKTFEENSDLCN